MKIAEELFEKYAVIEDKLQLYGFRKDGDAYYYHRLIHHDEFDLQIAVQDKRIDAKLIEIEFEEEYTLINVEPAGAFVHMLREECSQVLLDIREKCFQELYFVFPQTNRIADLIKATYGVAPERNKNGDGTNGVFRNPVTRKWIGLVMYRKKRNVTGDSEEKVEYLNLNFKEDAERYHQHGIYHPYKKNNKHWIVVIMDLVKISYEKSNQ